MGSPPQASVIIPGPKSSVAGLFSVAFSDTFTEIEFNGFSPALPQSSVRIIDQNSKFLFVGIVFPAFLETIYGNLV